MMTSSCRLSHQACGRDDYDRSSVLIGCHVLNSNDRIDQCKITHENQARRLLRAAAHLVHILHCLYLVSDRSKRTQHHLTLFESIFTIFLSCHSDTWSVFTLLNLLRTLCLRSRQLIYLKDGTFADLSSWCISALWLISPQIFSITSWPSFELRSSLLYDSCQRLYRW